MNSLNVDELRAATQAARDRQMGEPRSSRRPSVAGHMLHWVWRQQVPRRCSSPTST